MYASGALQYAMITLDVCKNVHYTLMSEFHYNVLMMNNSLILISFTGGGGLESTFTESEWLDIF